MAAVAVAFARYFLELTGLPGSGVPGRRGGPRPPDLRELPGRGRGQPAPERAHGPEDPGHSRPGGRRPAVHRGEPRGGPPLLDRPPSFDLVTAFGAALVPVLFSYGGWQTSGFVAGEMKRPERDMPRALLLGVVGVVVLYLAVNLVCLRVLGPVDLAHTKAPASEVMRLALGQRGATLIGLGITDLRPGLPEPGHPHRAPGLLRDGPGQALLPRRGLPAPRHAGAGGRHRPAGHLGRDHRPLRPLRADHQLRGLGRLHLLRSHRGVRSSSSADGAREGRFRTPGHPYTTVFFVAGCWLVVASVVYRYPLDSLVGWGILLCGLPAFLLWRAQGGLSPRPGPGLHWKFGVEPRRPDV